MAQKRCFEIRSNLVTPYTPMTESMLIPTCYLRLLQQEEVISWGFQLMLFKSEMELF